MVFWGCVCSTRTRWKVARPTNGSPWPSIYKRWRPGRRPGLPFSARRTGAGNVVCHTMRARLCPIFSSGFWARCAAWWTTRAPARAGSWSTARRRACCWPTAWPDTTAACRIFTTAAGTGRPPCGSFAPGPYPCRRSPLRMRTLCACCSRPLRPRRLA